MRYRLVRERWSARRFLLGAATLVVALSTGLVATGATYARWNSSAQGGSTTIKAGTAALEIAPVVPVPSTPMYPGLTVYGAYTVSNTGDTDLALNVASLLGPTTPTTFSAALTVAAGIAEAPACTSGTATLPWSGTFAAAPAGSLGGTVATKSSVTLCVAITLATTAASTSQGQGTSNFTLTIRGVQP